MSDWPALLTQPEHLRESDELHAWFTDIAARLLDGCRLVVAGQPHRFTEVEFYYCGPGHPDTFTHRDPIQLQRGRWYFHRTRGVYRGGSFEGFDLAFGDGTTFGGVLIRGLEAPGGTLVDGPSLCVDRLLRTTGHATVAALDEAVAGRAAWDAGSPLYLTDATGEGRRLYRSGRVGLSRKRAGKRAADVGRYIMRPYRYLSEPRRIGKGKPYLVLALYAQGVSPDDIPGLTGCPAKSVARYIEDFEAGRREADFSSYAGADLGPRDLCRLHGTWHERVGRPA
jgi:hypothetical protein